MKFDEQMKQELCQELVIPDVVDEKLQDVYQHILDGERKKKSRIRQDAKRRKRKMTAWIGAAAAVGIVVVTGSVLYSQPALARELPIIGNLFEKIINVSDRTTPKNKTAYEQIEKHSEKIMESGNTVDGNGAKSENTMDRTNAESENIADDSGVEISISDVYFDGYDLYYTISARTEDEELNSSEFLTFLNYVEGDPLPFTASTVINGIETVSGSLLQPRKSEDGSFVQLARISMDTIDGVNLTSSDTLDVKLEFNAIGGTKLEDIGTYDSFIHEAMGHKTIRGTWKLAFQTDTNQSGNRNLLNPSENQGFTITAATAAPSNLHLTVLVPFGWDSNVLDLQIFDSNGARVDWEHISYSIDEKTGQPILLVTANATEMSQFVVKIIDKSSSSGDDLHIVAEIPFALQ